MAVSPSISKAIRALRRELDSPPGNHREAFELHSAVFQMFEKSDRIVADAEPLGEVLALAPEVAAYWAGDEPDEATVELLRELESDPASRRMLVGVMQAQIELGLNDGFGAMLVVEDWEDRNEVRD